MTRFNHFIRSIRDRFLILFHICCRRDFVTPVGKLAQQSRFGLEILDISATMHPFELIDDDTARSLTRLFGALESHDFSAGELGLPSWSSEPEVSQFLAHMVVRNNYLRVVEIGCFVGASSAHLAAALSLINGTTKLTCVDPSPRYLRITERNVHPWIGPETEFRCVEGRSIDRHVIESLDQPIDMIFLDSLHDEESTLAEMDIYMPMLRPGGSFVFHDAVRFPGVRRAIRRHSLSMKSMTFATSGGNGCGLLLKPVDQTST